MRKLIRGIVEFHQKRRDEVKGTFAQLALGQKPDALFIACSDSRVAVNVFASTDPGDLFVVRNVGNLVNPFHDSSSDESEVAAIEFALENLGVKHLVVCGHSDCGAMRALCEGREKITLPYLRSWLRHGEEALWRVQEKEKGLSGLEQVNRVSRENVLLQIEHLQSYPRVARLLQERRLMLHALWFDIKNTEVHYAKPSEGVFRVIDEQEGKRILETIPGKP